jgi:molybdopterin synthase sulfur carrier subunit
MTERSPLREEADGGEEGPTVTVKVFGGLRPLLDESSIRIGPNTTIRAVLSTLGARLPAFAERLHAGLADGYLYALVNGRNVVFLEGLDTQLRSGDSVVFLPPVGGG